MASDIPAHPQFPSEPEYAPGETRPESPQQTPDEIPADTPFEPDGAPQTNPD